MWLAKWEDLKEDLTTSTAGFIAAGRTNKPPFPRATSRRGLWGLVIFQIADPHIPLQQSLWRVYLIKNSGASF